MNKLLIFVSLLGYWFSLWQNFSTGVVACFILVVFFMFRGLK